MSQADFELMTHSGKLLIEGKDRLEIVLVGIMIKMMVVIGVGLWDM